MNNKLMPPDQIAHELERRPNKRLNYKQESDQHKGEMLVADIERQKDALQLAASRERVNFHDVEQVRRRTYEYLEACKSSCSYPSVMDLSVYAYGYSRQGLNRFLREHPETPSAQFIEMVKDAFAAILVNQSLFRNADSVQAIFQLKNHADHADRMQIEPIAQADPLGTQTPPDELQQRILGSVIADDD